MKRISLVELCVQLVTPLAIIFAFFLFLRGHNQPGGGFIAGLVVAIAFVLYAIAFDLDRARRLLPTTLGRLFSMGLGIAAATGLLAIFFDRPFLTSAHGYVAIWPFGKTHLVTSALFDLGVFLVVISVVAGLVFQFAQRKCEIYWPVPKDEAPTFSERATRPMFQPLIELILGMEDSLPASISDAKAQAKSGENEDEFSEEESQRGKNQKTNHTPPRKGHDDK